MTHLSLSFLFRPAARLFVGLCAVLLIGGCATTQPTAETVQDVAASPWAQASQPEGTAPGTVPAWLHFTLPGKQANQYMAVKQDGRDAVLVRSDAAVSLLRQKLRVPPGDLAQIRFSWKVPQLIANANLAVRETSDSPVRIVLAFDGDRSRLSAKNAMLSELSHTLTGEPMPYATLMYVWCNQCERESVIKNTRTDRIQKIAIESGGKNLNQWLDYERDIRADFHKAFGEAPGALIGIAIMTDTDNTRANASAWYGKVRLSRQQRNGNPSGISAGVPGTNAVSSAK